MELIVLFIIVVVIFACLFMMGKKNSVTKTEKQNTQPPQPMHFDLLDENGDPIREDVKKSPTTEKLEYFCINDKGYHVTVWPKRHDRFDIVEFYIAGIYHRNRIDRYLGEFEGALIAEPDNQYDPNAIMILSHDYHHVGYVPKDRTEEIRKYFTLPCKCYCYIGTYKENDETKYYTDCYAIIPR